MLGADLVQRLQIIGDHRAGPLQLGLAANPNYDLDFALSLVTEAERLHAAKQGEAKTITDDPHVRSEGEYFSKFAQWAGIHRNWPAVLIKSYEMTAWIAYYKREIDACNQAGFYLSEVLSTYSFQTVPEGLRRRVNYFNLFDEVSMAMLCKYRWYRLNMSRFHKPQRLSQHEAEFSQAVKPNII